MHALPPTVRHLVLGGALLAASALAALPVVAPAFAATATSPVAAPTSDAAHEAAVTREVADAIREAVREVRREAVASASSSDAEAANPRPADVAADTTAEAAGAADASEPDAASAGAERKGANVRIGRHERRYDSFDDFVDRDPGLAFMITAVVFIVFLTPILIIGLVIWYKVRRNRMQSETLLKLAEKGIAPSAETMQGLGSGRVEASLARAASALPPVEQVQVLAKRAAWSDLRKGVVMATIGLALSLDGLIDDGRPGWFGLILLFVGAGYVVLWLFEERQTAATIDALRTTPPPSPRPPGLE